MRPRRVNKPLRTITSIDQLPVICDCAEAGLLLRVYPETVSKMARDGILPGAKIGQAWRFRRDDLEAYLDKLFQTSGADIKETLSDVAASERGKKRQKSTSVAYSTTPNAKSQAEVVVR